MLADQKRIGSVVADQERIGSVVADQERVGRTERETDCLMVGRESVRGFAQVSLGRRIADGETVGPDDRVRLAADPKIVEDSGLKPGRFSSA